MTPLFPARRAAEEFDRALTGSATPSVADRYADLLATVEVLRTQPAVSPRPEFASDLRSRLLTAAETDLASTPGVPRHLPVEPPSSASRSRLGTIAASLVLVGTGAGVAAAASGALPGDALYPVKRGLEDVSAVVRTSDAGKGEALLDHAATRLREIRDLQAGGSPDPTLVTATLDSFREAADGGSSRLFTVYQAGGETDLITAVRGFTAEQMSVLATLAAATDDPAITEALRDAADTVAAIDQQARVLCAVCGPRTTLEVPGPLTATPAAATFENLLERPVAQVSADLATLEQARLERLRRAAAVAEDRAAELPPPGAGDGGALPPTPVDGDTVTSLITGDGRAVSVPGTGGGPAGENLVSNVTGNLEAATGTAGKLTGEVTGKAPADDLVDGATDPLDGATDGVLP